MKAIRKHSIGMTHGNNVGAMISGKQLELRQGLNMAFHGSRLYFADLGRFATPDIFSDRFHWLSPWTYCAANPLNLTDPSGNYFINNRVDIDNFKDNLNSQISVNENLISVYRDINSRTGKDFSGAINQLLMANSYLQKCINTVERLQNDKMQAYLWDKSIQNENKHTIVKNGNCIVIQGSSDAMFGHELMHIDQYNGKEPNFNNDGELIIATDNGIIACQYEVDAYRTQYAIDRDAMPDFVKKPKKIADIHTKYLEKINKKTKTYQYVKKARKSIKKYIKSNDPNKAYYESFY